MAENPKKSRKRKWKEVPLDNPAFFSGNMEGFVQLEELQDYTFESFVTEGSRVVDTDCIAREESKGGKMPKMENETKKEKRKRKRKEKPTKDLTKIDKLIDGESKPQIANTDFTIGEESDGKKRPKMENKTKKEKRKRKRKKKPTKDPTTKADKTIKGENKPEMIEANEKMKQNGSQQNMKKGSKLDDMSDWNGLGVPDEVLKALSEHGFTTPTSIQALAIPPALFHHRDIVGAAETGSGKTLAFGIPIIHHIMAVKEHTANKIKDDNKHKAEDGKDNVNENPLMALIMTPTRELALQIKDHLVAAAKYTPIKVAAVVGGMAAQKQLRLLKKHPEIVVATPGRLWEMISSQEEHVSNLEHLRYLVIDEADRMIEQGHFEELSSILDAIHFKKSAKSFDSCFPEEDVKIIKNTPTEKFQKYIFSATLTFPKSIRRKGKDYVLSTEELQVRLLNKMNIDSKKAKIIDVTTKKGTAHTLTEARITCSKEYKDAYLYYFLLKYPGRTLIFANTIDCIRRLASILRLLQLNPLPLHASMQQRQRLKNLDRFKSSENGLLVSTDVAARGLDIPNVQHVIHYQVPKDPEVYIHRSGRTARALNEGLSVVLVGPEDLASYRKIMKTLNNGNDLESFPVDVPYITDVKSRISLARNIDKEQNKIQKKKSSNDWFVASAKAMDIEVDDDLLEDLGDSREKKVQQKKIDQMKASLSSMIKKPLVPKGFSGKFPTKSGKLVVPGLQDERSNTNDVVKTAVDDVKKKKKKKRQ